MFKDDEEDVSVFAFYVNIMPEESKTLFIFLLFFIPLYLH